MVDLIDLDFKVKHLQTDAITRTLGRAPRLKVLAPFSVIPIYSKFVSINVLESIISRRWASTIPALSLHHSQPSFQTINKDLKQKQFNIVPTAPLRYLPPSVGIYSSLCVSDPSSLFSVCFIIFISSHSKLFFSAQSSWNNKLIASVHEQTSCLCRLNDHILFVYLVCRWIKLND